MRRLIFATLLLTCIPPVQAQDRLAPGTGIVAGTIEVDGGGPRAGVRVAVIATDDPSNANLISLAETDTAGHFRLSNVPQGRYVVVAGPLNSLTYFPGGNDRTKAAEIVVDAARTLANINFKVPSGSRRPPPAQSAAKSAVEDEAYRRASNETKNTVKIGLLLKFERDFPQSALMARVYEDLLDVYTDQGELKAAMAYGDKLLEKEPENVTALIKASRAYGLAQSNLTIALMYGERAIQTAAQFKSLPLGGKPAAYRGYSADEWNKIVARMSEDARDNMTWLRQVVAWHQSVLNAAVRTRH